MLKKIADLFSRDKGEAQANRTQKADYLERPIEDYFNEGIKSSRYFLPEKRDLILNHLLGASNINESGDTLSADQKKALGFNPRIKLTSQLLSTLTNEGRLLKDPKKALEELYYHASFNKSRTDKFHQSVKAGITSFKLCASGDGSECEWCRTNDQKVFGVEILDKFNLNCACSPYSKCFIAPAKLPWEE
jgi:hypothetical protein